MTIETWKAIPGWDGLYEASTDGRIRSARTGAVLAGSINQGGYRKHNLSRNGRTVTIPAHVAVAAAFIGERPSGYHVAHRDGNQLNNRADNLRYATPLENIGADRRRHGTLPRGERNGRASLTEAQVRAIRASAQRGVQLAREYGVSHQLISAIRHNQVWAHLA